MTWRQRLERRSHKPGGPGLLPLPRARSGGCREAALPTPWFGALASRTVSERISVVWDPGLWSLVTAAPGHSHSGLGADHAMSPLPGGLVCVPAGTSPGHWWSTQPDHSRE